MGLVNNSFCATGYCVPFEDWPEEIKQYYSYDPEGAENRADPGPRLTPGATLRRRRWLFRRGASPTSGRRLCTALHGADGIRFETTFLHFDVAPVSCGRQNCWADSGAPLAFSSIFSQFPVVN